MADLISMGTRGRFRDLATSSTLSVLATAFQDEGFAPNYDSTYVDTSVRRQTAQQYMESVDWSVEENVARALRAIERIIEDFDQQYTATFWAALERDGYRRDADTKRLVPRTTRPQIKDSTLEGLVDPSVIKGYLNRLHGSADTDPELAIGSAKELIESTAKVVLTQLGVRFTKDDSLVQLATRAQESLKLHPKQAPKGGPDGSSGIKGILGGALGIATGVAELRNAYGTGHGRHQKPIGLGQRHAHLAANASYLWCELMLETLADPQAPWRESVSD